MFCIFLQVNNFYVLLLLLLSSSSSSSPFSYHMVSFHWYFSSWANGEPHQSAFKSQTVALSLFMCVVLSMSIFVETVLNLVLLFPDFLKRLLTISVAPLITSMTKHFMFHISWIHILRFLYLFFIILFLFTSIIIIIIIINAYQNFRLN
jgi:hypothetical protein